MKSKMPVRVGRMSKFTLILKSDIPTSEKAGQFFRIYGRFLGNIPVYVALIALSMVFLVPFFYMIGHSLMSVNDILNPSVKWLPRSLNLDNYEFAYRSMDYMHFLLKTLMVVGLAVFGQIMSCSFVAYGLARVNFKLKGLIFALVIFMLIVPPQTIIVPAYMMYSNIGWLHTFRPIIVPCFLGMGLNGGLIIFVFRQFFRGMPTELESAAMIDGTGVFGAYFRIVFPNAKPAILITSILAIVWQWNNYFEPSMYLEANQGLLTMQLEVLKNNVSSSIQGVDFNTGINMAGTFLTIIPIILIFFALQGRFMKNMANSGLAN